VDFQRGVGITRDRACPWEGPAMCFSQNPLTPQIAFVASGGQIIRVDTETLTVAPLGVFPKTIPNFGAASWFTNSRNDFSFVAVGTSNGVWAFLPDTDTTRYRTLAQLGIGSMDEPYLENDGRYVMPNPGDSTGSPLWDLVTDTIIPADWPDLFVAGHVGAVRQRWPFRDVNSGAGQVPFGRLRPDGTWVQSTSQPGYSADSHDSGNWFQPDNQLPGGSLDKQWFFRGTYDWSNVASGNGPKKCVAGIRIDGSEARLVFHHASEHQSSPAVPNIWGGEFWYYGSALWHMSPDGRVGMLGSNEAGMMGGRLQADLRLNLYIVEMPLGNGPTV
jgi:hypothetical protein